MASSTQSTQKMPIYKQADFECSHCNSIWQADYTEITDLRAHKAIKCKNCNKALAMKDDELQILNYRFAKSEKVSKRTIIFIIPYFLLCGITAIVFGGVATFIMLIIGFMIIITIRRSLIEDDIDHFHLIIIKNSDDNQSKPKQKKA
ncbi:hypothetical protein DM558_02885 [Entomomonas moraniae]|uniref:Uncharacterized protein n=1 Tax=Entomomonas moraniae TaxID=2213226 RepID=A0A3Q9JHK7_9GAMM|nr:hypothetical protein [Entomomonas moraniae]AZS49788.1 hypothetical protein DM558_02885 [Entomomonas moraniae]